MALTMDELMVIDRALRTIRRKVVEIDPEHTEWDDPATDMDRSRRYAVTDLNASHARPRDRYRPRTYVTDVNAERIVRGQRRRTFHRVYGFADTLAEAVLVALQQHKEDPLYRPNFDVEQAFEIAQKAQAQAYSTVA